MVQSFVVWFGASLLLLGFNKAVALTPVGRIIDGEFTTVEEFPYQAYISYKNVTHCGGSIINKLTILTAAHCIAPAKMDALAVRVGVTDVTKSGGVTRNVAKAIVHENFDEQTVENDIAILILDQPLDYTNSIKPIKLPDPDKEAPVGTKAFVSGWGTIGPGKPTSPILKVAKLSIVDREDCAKHYQVTNKMMCAGTGLGRVCNCDSGGPLAIFDPERQPKLVGLVSFGDGCETKNPDVYTQVSSYIDWIRERMQ